MKKITKVMSGVIAVVLAGMACVSCKKENNGGILDGGKITEDTQNRIVKVESLEDYSLDRECWLSIPDSELVINPFPFKSNMDTDHRQTEFFNRENMSIDLGILDSNSNGKKVENVMGLSAVSPYGGHQYAKSDYNYGWRPDRLLYSAEYDNGLKVDAYDYFYDENTIVRNVSNNGKNLAFFGGYAAGAADSYRLQDNIFVYRGGTGVTIAFAFSVSGKWSFYDNETDFIDSEYEHTAPEQSGVWCYTPDKAELVSVSVAVGQFGEKTEDVVARAKRPYEKNDFVKQAGEREKDWNIKLSSCPVPETFEFTDGFDTKDMTANDVRNYYYRSYAQIIANVLPSNANFEYRIISVGKASMWYEGSPESKYSAIWESLFGTQMMSFVDADIAWELCQGIMAIIPEDGNILGESLPSNKASTVWTCYSAKRDKEKLAACVTPLTKYLNWRFENPRWIIGDYNNPEECDLDFASAYLVDLKFMIKICNELGRTDDAAYWADKADAMYENMKQWFFSGEVPVQYYFKDTGKTISGTPLWIGKTLWSSQLEGESLQKVLKLLVAQYNVEKPFAGYGGVKYDDWAYTLYGLVKNGRADIAKDMVQAILRDIPRSGFIGELYNANWRGTVCEGVRPSMFGAILMIDNVWLRNGFMYHEGGIGAMNLFDGEGGVSNIRLDGAEYSIHMNGAAEKYIVTKNGTPTTYNIKKGTYTDPVR